MDRVNAIFRLVWHGKLTLEEGTWQILLPPSCCVEQECLKFLNYLLLPFLVRLCRAETASLDIFVIPASNSLLTPATKTTTWLEFWIFLNPLLQRKRKLIVLTGATDLCWWKWIKTCWRWLVESWVMRPIIIPRITNFSIHKWWKSVFRYYVADKRPTFGTISTETCSFHSTWTRGKVVEETKRELPLLMLCVCEHLW